VGAGVGYFVARVAVLVGALPSAWCVSVLRVYFGGSSEGSTLL
jgi:hypothetical protein